MKKSICAQIHTPPPPKKNKPKKPQNLAWSARLLQKTSEFCNRNFEGSVICCV